MPCTLHWKLTIKEMGVKTGPVEQRQMRIVNLIEFWSFIFNNYYPRRSIRQFNCCLLVSLITVTLNTRTDQDASAQGTVGLVLTDVGSVKSNGFDS